MAEVNGPTEDPTTGERRAERVEEDGRPGVAVPAADTSGRRQDVEAEPASRWDERDDDVRDTDRTPAAPAVATTAERTQDTDRTPTGPVTVAKTAPVAAAPVAPEPLEPAATGTPRPPRRGSNRLAGTAWVLLAAGLFEVLFFAVNALVALVFGGPGAVPDQIRSIAGTSLAWLPVVLFFLLFELTVLLFNRAGRVAYVFASLIVGAIVYVATVLLFSFIVRHALGDSNTLAQTFLNWEFILVGLVAREVMLWTGLAIGSRGIRVRRRNRAERQRYAGEIADARA